MKTVKYLMKKIIILLGMFFCCVIVAEAKTTKHHKHKHVVHSQKCKKVTESFSPTRANILLVNLTDNSIINGEYSNNKVSIASISKLMTVYTVLKSNQDFDEVLTVTNRLSNHTRLAKGMTLTRRDLVKLALVHSDNLAAQTLAENFPGGYHSFIYEMNKNAVNLGMNSTVFYEPTGLDPNNSSTLNDIAILTMTASHYQTFRDAAKSENVTITANKGKKTYKIVANATNKMFGKEGVITIKTGFTNAAGFCITMLVNIDNKLYNLVILGARSSQERQKIIERSLQTLRYI
jgi:D-alanyl-D-alanine endopeptidase (penicillin-binding protein 7)